MALVQQYYVVTYIDTTDRSDVMPRLSHTNGEIPARKMVNRVWDNPNGALAYSASMAKEFQAQIAIMYMQPKS